MLFQIIRASPPIVPATGLHTFTHNFTSASVYQAVECFAMSATSQLNIRIADIIDDAISNWETEYSRITIESFQRKKDCLVIIKIRKFSHNHHFLKTAISIDSSNILHLRTLFSHFQSFCRL